MTPTHDISQTNPVPEQLARARGCWLGQLAGDSLGGLVEFRYEEAKIQYPNGVRELADGGTWRTLAGQPTDDSEMALALARSLVEARTFDPKRVLAAYKSWLHSRPFDVGITIIAALCCTPDRDTRNFDSQANGALMRISPLGIFGASIPVGTLSEWAKQDAALTHPHPICQQINALFATAIAFAIRERSNCTAVYEFIKQRAEIENVEPELKRVICDAAKNRPQYYPQVGWVLIAFQNALWQLLHAQTLEDAVVDTVFHGGDTDTNAAICGALLGAVYGESAIPAQWKNAILNCRPSFNNPAARRPRPECYWPDDALELAEKLLCLPW